MKFKGLFVGILLCILAVLIPQGVSAQAAISKKIVLTPATVNETHGSVWIDVSAKLKNVVSIEVKRGKIKKTADKYWKDCEKEDIYLYYNKETKTTESTFFAYENGTYSVRLTVKSGKKYVNYITVKNLAPVSERGKMTARITGVSEPDSKGNYTITADYKANITMSFSDLKGKKVGDVISVNGRKVEITRILTMDDAYTTKEQKKVDDNTECVVVFPKKASDFYDTSDEYYSYILENPDSAAFGFIRSFNSKDVFVAYEDYDYWADGGDYYVPLTDTVYTDVKLKVTAKTNVKLAYSPTDRLSGTDYFAVWNGTKEIEGVYIMPQVDVHIYEKVSKDGQFTDTVSEIVEIYTP